MVLVAWLVLLSVPPTPHNSTLIFPHLTFSASHPHRLSATWLCGAAVERAGIPALVAEIVVGMVLGPPALDVIPYVPAL